MIRINNESEANQTKSLLNNSSSGYLYESSSQKVFLKPVSTQKNKDLDQILNETVTPVINK